MKHRRLRWGDGSLWPLLALLACALVGAFIGAVLSAALYP